jgi:hypothetical protein
MATDLSWLANRLALYADDPETLRRVQEQAGGDPMAQARAHQEELKRREGFTTPFTSIEDPNAPLLGPGESPASMLWESVMTPPSPSELAKRPEASPALARDTSEMPPIDQPESAPSSQMYSYLRDGKRVFGNVLPGVDAPLAERSYEQGLEQWQAGARTTPSPAGSSISGATGDFRVRPGRGGFSPSAEIPTPGAATAEEWNDMSPLQRDIYNERTAQWRQQQAMEAEVDPLAVYNRAAAAILQQPEVQAQINVVRDTFGKMLELPEGDPKHISQEQYDTIVAGETRKIIDQAMMRQGASRAALDPQAHYRAGLGLGL